MNITVYCGVSEGTDKAYTDFARELGSWIGESGHTLVYGGGGIGMMGTVANATLDHGGSVIGIYPHFLSHRERILQRLEDPIEVETMAIRKMKLIDHADAFCVLPGGIGTLEEITEVISQKSLELLDVPILIANVNGYYDRFIDLLHFMEKQGFLRLEPSWFHVVTSIEQIEAILGKSVD